MKASAHFLLLLLAVAVPRSISGRSVQDDARRQGRQKDVQDQDEDILDRLQTPASTTTAIPTYTTTYTSELPSEPAALQDISTAPFNDISLTQLDDISSTAPYSVDHLFRKAISPGLDEFDDYDDELADFDRTDVILGRQLIDDDLGLSDSVDAAFSRAARARPASKRKRSQKQRAAARRRRQRKQAAKKRRAKQQRARRRKAKQRARARKRRMQKRRRNKRNKRKRRAGKRGSNVNRRVIHI